MRATLHLVRPGLPRPIPLLQPMLSAALHRGARRTAGLELEPVVAAARACLEERPRTFDEVRAVLRKAWPKADERALGYAVRTHLALVQVPAETRWGWPGAAAFAVAETWLGSPLPAAGDLRALVLRYLAGFGPAGPRDAETWSGLVQLRETFEALRPRLRVFRDEKGRELFDLPKAPRPPARRPRPSASFPTTTPLSRTPTGRGSPGVQARLATRTCVHASSVDLVAALADQRAGPPRRADRALQRSPAGARGDGGGQACCACGGPCPGLRGPGR